MQNVFFLFLSMDRDLVLLDDFVFILLLIFVFFLLVSKYKEQIPQNFETRQPRKSQPCYESVATFAQIHFYLRFYPRLATV